MRNLLRPQRKTDASFSVDKDGIEHMSLSLPKSWKDLSQSQLIYICKLLAEGKRIDELKFYCFIHFSSFKVVSQWGKNWILAIRTGWIKRKEMLFSTEDIARICKEWLSWMDETPKELVCVNAYKQFKAVNLQLHGITFKEFLDLENLWQGYMYSQKSEPLERMVSILYADKNGNKPKKFDGILCSSVILWFGAFKNFCYEHWPNLFSKSASGDSEESVDVESITNMQIRALTGGDITKEREVLEMDVWRALTELDAKAADAKEQRRQLNEMKSKK